MNLETARARSIGESVPILAIPQNQGMDEVERFNRLAYRFDTMKKLRRSDISQDIFKGHAYIKAVDEYPDITVAIKAYSGLDRTGDYYKGISALRVQWLMSELNEGDILPLGPQEVLSLDQPDLLVGDELEFAFASLETSFAAIEQALAPPAHS